MEWLILRSGAGWRRRALEKFRFDDHSAARHPGFSKFMARPTKNQLFARVLDALDCDLWDVEALSTGRMHPRLVRLSFGPKRILLRVYIWNLSHGGKSRSANEFRIQVTGISRFQRLAGEQTLILGWSDSLGVFAAFDFARHSGLLGSSPSFQILEDTLKSAATSGIAANLKGNNEVVVAFRPDFLGSYISEQASLHSPTEVEAAIQALRAGATSDVPAQLDHYIRRHLSGDRLTLGSGEERAQRARITQNASLFEHERAEAWPSGGMIGHNRPPPDRSAWVAEVAEAVEFVRQEMQRAEPDPTAVAERGKVLDRAAKAWRAMVAEMKKFPNAIAEKARDHAAEAFFALAVGILIKIIGGILAWLGIVLG